MVGDVDHRFPTHRQFQQAGPVAVDMVQRFDEELGRPLHHWPGQEGPTAHRHGQRARGQQHQGGQGNVISRFAKQADASRQRRPAGDGAKEPHRRHAVPSGSGPVGHPVPQGADDGAEANAQQKHRRFAGLANHQPDRANKGDHPGVREQVAVSKRIGMAEAPDPTQQRPQGESLEAVPNQAVQLTHGHLGVGDPDTADPNRCQRDQKRHESHHQQRITRVAFLPEHLGAGGKCFHKTLAGRLGLGQADRQQRRAHEHGRQQQFQPVGRVGDARPGEYEPERRQEGHHRDEDHKGPDVGDFGRLQMELQFRQHHVGDHQVLDCEQPGEGGITEPRLPLGIQIRHEQQAEDNQGDREQQLSAKAGLGHVTSQWGQQGGGHGHQQQPGDGRAGRLLAKMTLGQRSPGE